MAGSEVYLIVSALGAAVTALASYVAKLQADRIRQLEADNKELRDRLEAASDRTAASSATLERVVNAALDRERELMQRLASTEATKGGGG